MQWESILELVSTYLGRGAVPDDYRVPGVDDVLHYPAPNQSQPEEPELEPRR